MRFAKLHGAGNDFLLFDGRSSPELEDVLPALVARMCHRRLGVGADGVLLLLPVAERAARLHYWNSDGSPAAFCANGTRCAARFVADRWGWQHAVIETGFAAVATEVRGASVTLRLPAPAAVHAWCDLETAGGSSRCRYAVIGVPHLVVPVDWPDFWRHPLLPLAPALRRHPELPAAGRTSAFSTARRPDRSRSAPSSAASRARRWRAGRARWPPV